MSLHYLVNLALSVIQPYTFKFNDTIDSHRDPDFRLTVTASEDI